MATNTTATTTTPDLGSMLSAAIAGGYVAHSSGGTYTVSSPIVIQVNSTIQGPLGIDLGGATIVLANHQWRSGYRDRRRPRRRFALPDAFQLYNSGQWRGRGRHQDRGRRQRS